MTKSTSASKNLFTKLCNELKLSPVLTERVRLVSAPDKQICDVSEPTFVLYLPTVVLRSQHNPAFALACHLANHFNVPLLVLSTILDDAHHNLAVKNDDSEEKNGKDKLPIVGTARRLCFQLQALQKACREWQLHGATVAMRVHHGPSTRRPHHLTLARQALFTVTDEPFVYPYRSYVQSIAKASRICLCVDGTTTVPPLLKLCPMPNETFAGVPPKAWMWEKKIQGDLQRHVQGVVQEGAMDAPQLKVKIPSSVTFYDNRHALYKCLPREWKDASLTAPSERAWTVDELCSVDPLVWAMQCPGIDTTVPPCRQTHGAHGWQRWTIFQRQHLASYQKKRNDIRQPHAVSRLSCYLNVGSISIFQIVHELWQDVRNTHKFEDEIIKWREISHAHAFSTPGYFGATALPQWSREYLERADHSSNQAFSLRALCESLTTDPTWNAMQTYLRKTGELHNNARMTWGKTVVHWQKSLSTAELLQHMACLNDRYALDGLSPPSYAGLLWCLGWCDKPWSGGSISTKPASRYRVGPEGFVEARKALLAMNVISMARQFQQQQQQQPQASNRSGGVLPPTSAAKRKSPGSSTKGNKRRSIDSYFLPEKKSPSKVK